MGIDLGVEAAEEIVARCKGQHLFDGHGHFFLGLLFPDCLGGPPRRLMGGHRVHGVVDVLKIHLPVAADDVANHTAGHHQAPAGRTISHVVQPLQRIAEVGREIDALSVQSHEDEIPVHGHRADMRQALSGFTLRHLRAGVLLAQRNAQRASVKPIAPCVIGALQHLACVAAGICIQFRAFVGTAIVENADGAIGLAHHQQWAPRKVHGDVVARERDLTAMCDEVPGGSEKAALLLFEYRRGNVGVAVHAVCLHQMGEWGGGRWVHNEEDVGGCCENSILYSFKVHHEYSY